MAGKKSSREEREEILKKMDIDLDEIHKLMKNWRSWSKSKGSKKKRGGKIMQGYKAGGKVQDNNMKLNGFEIIESKTAMTKRLNKIWKAAIGKSNKPKIKTGTKKRGGGKIMQGYKAGGKV